MQIRWWFFLVWITPALAFAQKKTTPSLPKASEPSAVASNIAYGTVRAITPQTPGSMQNVFRPPKRPKARSRVFDFAQYCGLNDTSRHTAYICVLEDGRIFGGIPPNIDQNDRIIVYLIVRRWLSHIYTIKMVRKRQVQLLPSGEVIPLNELKPPKKETFIVKKFVFGPFPAGSIQLIVKRPSVGRAGLGQVMSLREIEVNPLVQFNLAVAFIGVTPVKTKFGLFRERGSSLTRIARKEQGAFELDLILIAKIYSWQIWDADLFAGRDVLKPPTFLQRININLGFSFQDLFTSFYVGVGFEVNRGLDIVIGVNLRSVDILSGGFEEGNLFSGDESEIPVRQEIKPALYIGMSITPEIFRSIFSILSSGSLFKK